MKEAPCLSRAPLPKVAKIHRISPYLGLERVWKPATANRMQKIIKNLEKSSDCVVFLARIKSS